MSGLSSSPAVAPSASPTAKANTTSSTAATTTPAPIDDASLVLYVNLFIASLIFVLVLVRARRLIARFYSSDEWTSGIFLRNLPTKRTSVAGGATVERNVSVKTTTSSFKDFATDDSHSFYTHTTSTPRRRGNWNYPPHVPSCPPLFRPIVLPLWYRLSDGYSVSNFLVQLIWFSSLLFAALYSSQGPFLDPFRVSWIGISQLPFVFSFSAKNNIISILLGTGYEKLNFMHRFLGRLVVLAVNIHAIDYFYKWVIAGDFLSNISHPTNYYGLIGLICADFLFFFSTSWWRRKAYDIFLSTHLLGYVGIFPAVWFHNAAIRPYLLVCFFVIGFDRVLRLLKSRVVTAKIRPIPELGVTRIDCKSLNAGWRAGQHVRVRVLTTGMGLFGWYPVHPFSIASVAVPSRDKEGEGLILMCKKTKNANSWTNKLFNLAKKGAHDADYEKGDSECQVRVVIEGPYGGTGDAMLASYSAVVLVLGGSGITYGLSVMKDLVQKDLLGQSRVKSLEVVWVVQDAASLLPLLSVFTSLIRQSSPTTNTQSYTSLKISVYYTRAAIGKFPFPEDYFAPFHPKLTLSPGRPKIGKVIEGAMSRIVRIKDDEPSGVAVAVCGPEDMADEVSAEVGKLDEGRRDKVGGVEVIEEAFSW